MKGKLGLLGVVVGAVALALVGVLQDVTTTKALIPLPVRPIAQNTTMAGGQSTNQLGQVQDSYAAAIAHRGTRSAASAGWSRGGAGMPDITIDDGVPLGDFNSITDLFCDSATLNDGDLISAISGINDGCPASGAPETAARCNNKTDDDADTLVNDGCPAIGPAESGANCLNNADDDLPIDSAPVPFTFDEGNTDLADPSVNLAYLAPRAGIFPMTDRFGTNIDGVWLFGAIYSGLTGSSMIPVNIFSLHIPWAPNSGVSQIWVGGAAAKPGTLCSDSGQNDPAAPTGAVSRTMGSWTTPIALTNTPPLKGDSDSPCSGGNCADKQVYGFWPDKSIVDASGGAQTIPVTQRALNAGPNSGTFKDVWHAEGVASGVTATWGATITERRWNGTSWAAEAAPTVTPTGGGVAEISFVEDALVAGDTYEDAGSLTLTCVGTSDYIVAIKAAAYPVSPTKDNDLVSNVYISTIRVKCGTTAGEVDKQAISLVSALTGITGPNAAESLSFNRPITATTPPGDHLQLRVGDTATLNFRELLRNVGSVDAAALNVLGAEAPDMDGNGTYDISVNWVDGSTTAVYGSDPDAQTPISVTDACVVGGGMACPTLNVSMTEPDGPMIMVRADLSITCNTAGRYLIPVKAVDMATALADSAPVNNVSWSSLSVSCWADAAAKAAADDGIDDNTGLYSSFNSATSEADLRKSGSAATRPATGIASDTGYVERWAAPDCFWYDGDDDAPDTNGDGWISGSESLTDPDLVALGGVAAVDSDGDCVADAAYAQPGKPVDHTDVAGGDMCPVIVYNEGNAPVVQVAYSKSADEDCDGLIDGNEYVFGSNPRMADSDGDGISDFLEVFMLTNPLNPDTDGDGYKDAPAPTYLNSNTAYDNCPAVYNPDQANNDGARRANGAVLPGTWASNPNQDKLGDACDEDDDNDRAMDIAETSVAPFTNPLVADTDGDRCVDGWESIALSDPTSATSKCPGTLTPALQTLARGCHLNLPGKALAPSFAGPLPDHGSYMGTEFVEMDPDGDGILCQSGGAITDPDSDNGKGLGVAPIEISDKIEAFGYNTAVSNKDTDGDGCEDWVEIADVNGDRVSNIIDVQWVAKRVFNVVGASDSDPIFDIDKNGAINVLDVQLEAQNSSLVKSNNCVPNPEG